MEPVEDSPQEGEQFVETPEPTTPPTPFVGRLTVVDTVYYEQNGEEPVSFESRFQRRLDSESLPWRRTAKVTTSWSQIDFGWLAQEVDSISCLSLRCDGPNPLLVSFDEDERGWVVWPGETLRGVPSHFKQLTVKSETGASKYTLFATAN